MVNFSTIAIIGGLGLLIFFRKDIGQALESFKGFGSEFGRDFGKLPDININVPSFGIPEAFAETGKVAGETGAVVTEAIGATGQAIEQAGKDTRDVIFQAGVDARESFDKSIQETQNNFEQFGQDVQTNLDIIGTGITNFFGGIFPTKEITTVSEATPTIISRRAGTTTRFGGQTAPKEILTKETATTQEVIVSEQPDLTKLSPFLSIQSFAKAVTDKPELITVEQEATTSRFSGSGSFR